MELTDEDVLAMKNKIVQLTRSLLARHPRISEVDAATEAIYAGNEWFKRVKLAICEAEE